MSLSIKINQLRKSYRCRHSNEKSFVLQVEQLQLSGIGVHLFVGESGCGKSTLLDALGLISRVDCAEDFTITTADGSRLLAALARESDLALWRRAHIGYILQMGGLLRFMTLRDNLLYRIKLAGKQGREQNDRMISLSQRLGIEPQLNKWPEELSIGQRQRAAVALALIHRPSIVLADEPTGSLDSLSAARMRDILLENAHEEGVLTIIVSHDENLFCDHVDAMYGFSLSESSQYIQSKVSRIDNDTQHLSLPHLIESL